MWQRQAIEQGQKFTKVRDRDHATWIVDLLVRVPGLPPHARLVRENDPLESITVSVPTLSDAKFFRRVSMI